MKKYDVFGIGSALMDFLIEIDDNELIEMDISKGEMHLIGSEKSKEILKKLEKYDVKTAPGGSSANVLAGVATLGGSAVFCGKIGKDKHGDIYEQKSIECGVCTRLGRHDKKATGHSIALITPDSERTFATHLGAALHLEKEDVFEDDIIQSKILHTDCYQLVDAKLREVSLHAIDIAKKNSVLISIDLADPKVVRENLDIIKKIIKENADIVFANEGEAKEFTGEENEEKALDKLSKYCKIAVVKLGSKGSIVKENSNVHVINAYETKAVDTTGAGDMYAAGFLYGIAKEIPLEKAGKIGSWASSKIVSQIGARLNVCLKDEIKKFE